MAQFVRVEHQDINRTAYEITDDDGHTAHLSPQQALDLLQWLYERQDDLEIAVQPPTQTLKEHRVEREQEE